MTTYVADAWSLYDTIILNVEHYVYFDMPMHVGYAIVMLSEREDCFVMRISFGELRKPNLKDMEGIRIWFKDFLYEYPNEIEIELRPEFEMDFDVSRHPDGYRCIIVI